jgi:hypothetical protein
MKRHFVIDPIAIRNQKVEHLRQLVAEAELQAETWQSVVRWSFSGESTVDSQARMMYAMALVNGTEFEDWFDEIAGRKPGFNAPPESILRVLRPYLFGKMEAANAT